MQSIVQIISVESVYRRYNQAARLCNVLGAIIISAGFVCNKLKDKSIIKRDLSAWKS